MSEKNLRILISGASGFVGSELATFLKGAGHSIVTLKRGAGPNTEDTVFWDPENKKANQEGFEHFDAVFHLAGKSIVSIPWTPKKKREIYSSRVDGTQFLCGILSGLEHPPKTLICASAIGIYGDRAKEVLTEESAPGTGFLANVCKDWESASSQATGMRVIQTRFGHILSSRGGLLKTILPIFRSGFGAIIGTGEQIISWIALEDVVQGLYHCLMTPSIEGPVNFTTESPETNASYSKKIAKAVHRPLFLRFPEKLLKMFFGEMADEMFLVSSHVIPNKLKSSKYQLKFETLDAFLKQHFS